MERKISSRSFELRRRVADRKEKRRQRDSLGKSEISQDEAGRSKHEESEGEDLREAVPTEGEESRKDGLSTRRTDVKEMVSERLRNAKKIDVSVCSLTHRSSRTTVDFSLQPEFCTVAS